MRIKTQTLVRTKIPILVPIVGGSSAPEVDNLLLEDGSDFLLEMGGYILLEEGSPPIVTDQLVVHLDASNPASYSGSGTTWTNLVSGGLYNATWTAAGGLSAPPTFVADGQASYFNCVAGNVSQRQTADITGLDLRTDFSLEMWVRIRNVGDQYFFGQGTNTANQGLQTKDNGGVKDFAMVSNNYSVSNGYFGNGEWKQIVFTYDHSSPYTKTVYENGLKVGNSTTGQNAYAGTGTFRLNTLLSTGGGFSPAKQIGIARVYTKTLTDAEVFQNFVANSSRFNVLPLTPTMRVNLDFDSIYSYPGTGTNVLDVAGQCGNIPFSASPGCVYDTGFGGNLQFSGTPDPGNADSIIDFASVATSYLPWHSVNPTMTLDWWIMLTSSGSKTHTLLGSANTSTLPQGNRFTFAAETIGPSHTTARLRVKQSTGATAAAFSTSYSIPVGSVVNVTLTKTGSTYKLYINGVFKETIVDGSALTYSTGQSAIGTNWNPGATAGQRAVEKLQGNIYNFRAYSSVLTDAQVLENFNFFKSKFGL